MFQGPRLKIKRANQHIGDLQAVIADFIKTDFYRLSADLDPDDGMFVLKLEQTKETPEAVPLILGDAVHNLRAALDLLACDIVKLGGDEPTTYTKFPFQLTREQLIATLNGGKLKAGFPGVIDLIVDTIKPYKGGNDSLFGIHDLDIQDKHLLITPVFAVTSLQGIVAMDEMGNSFQGGITISDNSKFRPIATKTRIKIASYGQPVFDVRFAKDQPFEGQSVLPTLHQLSQLVSGVVQTVEKAYISSKGGTE